MAALKKNPQRIRQRFGLRLLDIGIMTVAIALIIFGVWRTFTASSSQPCSQPGQVHELAVNNDAFTPSHLTLAQCDTIKIVNRDPVQSYKLAFGVHDKHVVYPGFAELVVRPNEFISVDAVKPGNYRMHDHLRDKAAIEFTIAPK